MGVAMEQIARAVIKKVCKVLDVKTDMLIEESNTASCERSVVKR